MFRFDSKELLLFLLYCASFQALTILFSFILKTLEKKFCWKFLKWYYKYPSPICVIISAIILSTFLLKKESLSDLLTLGVCASFFLILKVMEPYSDTDINNCQEDNKSIGAFWAHQAFEFYYKIVFKDLIDRMKLFEKEHNIKFSIYKLFIIIPLTCDVESIFCVKGNYIEYFGDLPLVECDQGGNVNREYKNPVYRIKEELYIVAEYPSSLGTLQKTKFNLMKESEWKYHRESFIKTLKMLTKSSPCTVATYNDVIDKPEPFSNTLISFLNEESRCSL